MTEALEVDSVLICTGIPLFEVMRGGRTAGMLSLLLSTTTCPTDGYLGPTS
jgi:hypothetical protein